MNQFKEESNMPGIFNPGTNAKQYVNSLAGATVLDGQDIRAQNNAVSQHGIPIRNNVQYQNPILAAIGNAGNKVAQGLAGLMGSPEQLNNYVASGSDRDKSNAQIEAYFVDGTIPKVPTRDFLRMQQQQQAK